MITLMIYLVFFMLIGLLMYYFRNDNPDNLYLNGLEILLSGLLIGILVSLAIPVYNNYIEKAKNSKYISQIADFKLDASIYYAEQGIWPPAKEQKSYDNKIKSVLNNNGVIVIDNKEKNQQLVITGLIRKDEQGTVSDSILWLCGYAKAPLGYSKSPDIPSTTISASQLPSDCVY